MLQAIIKKGVVIPDEISPPMLTDNNVLIKVFYSCISAGTEMSSVSMSGKPLYKRAFEQPLNVVKVVDMARTVGISKTIAKVRGVLDGGSTTGYSVSGIVLAVGKNVKNIQTGELVAAAGAGYAHHAEYVEVPENLVMKVPQGLPLKEASTVTLGGIALQGVRRADLRLGESCLVVGAGILGLLTAQFLKISGVRVAVSDLDENRLEVAKKLGVDIVINPMKENTVEIVSSWTGGYGADSVIFTAATSSSAPLSDSFKATKKKGRVVLVGVSGMEIKREDIYQKEIDFLISSSYGPGRYDSNYEEKGLDYPYAFVRWTENRNMREYLRLVQEKRISLELLIDSVYDIGAVEEAYGSLQSADPKPLIVLLSYGEEQQVTSYEKYLSETKKVIVGPVARKNGKINFALVGAGGFATGMHLPNLEKQNGVFSLAAVMNKTGHKAKVAAKQYEASYATSDFNDILQDDKVDMVLIATRHDSHAEMTLKSLQAGKHVFVEKPLAVTPQELNQILDFYKGSEQKKPALMVGFNRRFSPLIQEVKSHVDKRVNPLMIHYRMNAGFIPKESWIHEDGGRIIGECCHIIDLMTFLTGSIAISVHWEQLNPSNDKLLQEDNCAITIKFQDGSVATIHYFAIGSKELAKEYMEVHFDGKSILMNDYKNLKGFGLKLKTFDLKVSNKGQFEEMVAWGKCLQNGNDWPIALWELEQATRLSFAVQYGEF
jgi:predicted dehydrogenase/threonine dehydrogenase-like Zn-dependent dehydrogenase